MKKLLLKTLKLAAGLIIMGFSLAMSVHSNLGLSPWEVLNDGISRHMGVQIGTAGIVVGFLILAFEIAFKEKVGLATFLNILVVGSVCNLVLSSGILPDYFECQGLEHLIPRLALCIGSMILVSFSMYLYMDVQWGAGPRDTLMVMLTRKTPLKVGAVRFSVEGIAFIAGFLMGGKIGLGSVVLVALGGPIMGVMFKLLRFDVTQLKNESIPETIKVWRAAMSRETV